MIHRPSITDRMLLGIVTVPAYLVVCHLVKFCQWLLALF
jgi:hypothetical protein